MESEWLIEFVDANPISVHVVRVPLNRKARDSLIEKLMGGIVLAQLGDVPREAA